MIPVSKTSVIHLRFLAVLMLAASVMMLAASVTPAQTEVRLHYRTYLYAGASAEVPDAANDPLAGRADLKVEEDYRLRNIIRLGEVTVDVPASTSGTLTATFREVGFFGSADDWATSKSLHYRLGAPTRFELTRSRVTFHQPPEAPVTDDLPIGQWYEPYLHLERIVPRAWAAPMRAYSSDPAAYPGLVPADESTLKMLEPVLMALRGPIHWYVGTDKVRYRPNSRPGEPYVDGTVTYLVGHDREAGEIRSWIFNTRDKPLSAATLTNCQFMDLGEMLGHRVVTRYVEASGTPGVGDLFSSRQPLDPASLASRLVSYREFRLVRVEVGEGALPLMP
jgi:hypothetical protein